MEKTAPGEATETQKTNLERTVALLTQEVLSASDWEKGGKGIRTNNVCKGYEIITRLRLKT